VTELKYEPDFSVDQMMLANHTSRFDVAIAAIRGGAHVNPRVAVDAHEHESYMKHLAQKERDYIYQHGKGSPALDHPFSFPHRFLSSLDNDYIFDTPKF